MYGNTVTGWKKVWRFRGALAQYILPAFSKVVQWQPVIIIAMQLNTQTLRHSDTQTLRHSDTQTLRHSDTQNRHLAGSLARYAKHEAVSWKQKGNTKRTAAGIPTWSPTVVLICRSTAYVWQSGRDAQFSADC
ncbi:hypothetical protein KCU77_g8571, partial [Aureobasidium melanogenum]